MLFSDEFGIGNNDGRVEECKKFDTVSNWISQERENYFIISGERKNGGCNGLE